jgi:hypothetical protein
MTKWHLMAVGLLALVAAVLVGLNWTSVDQTVDLETETEPEPVKTKTQQAPAESEGARSDLQAKLEARCEKALAKRVVGEDQEAEIEDACACAADEIYSEFEEELPNIIESGKADPETEDRMDEIVGECVQSAGMELK